MRSRGLLLLLVVALGAAAAYWYLGRSDAGASGGSDGSDGVVMGQTAYKSKHGFDVTVTQPTSGATVTSPLAIKGVVPGPWSFEANIPIKILDDKRQVVADSYGTVVGEWMTEKPVNFTASIPFKAPVTDKGFIVISKSNPSGDQATEDSVEIPIQFGR